MAYYLGETLINKRYLGNVAISKLMLGVSKVYPWTVPFHPSDLYVDALDGSFYTASELDDAKLSLRRNIYIGTNNYSTATWQKTNCTVVLSGTPNPVDGGGEVYEVTAVNGAAVMGLGSGSAGDYGASPNMTQCYSIYYHPGTNAEMQMTLVGPTIKINTSTDVITVTQNGSQIYNYGVEILADGWRRLWMVAQKGNIYWASTFGPIGTSPTPFKIYGWQGEQRTINVNSPPTAYQRVTDWTTEFLNQYPAHTLYQLNSVQTPVNAIEQPVGAALSSTLLLDGFVDVTGATWNKTQGDGVVTISGDGRTITITGATTATYVNRTAGSIPFTSGFAQMSVTATHSGTTGVGYWLRGAPSSTLTSGTAKIMNVTLNNSTLERFDITTGTVTFVINYFRYAIGHHASQSTTAAKPTYSARKNLLLATENLSDAWWAKNNITVARSTTVAPNGRLAWRITDNATSGEHTLSRGNATAGDTSWRTISVDVKGETARYIAFTLSIGVATDTQVYNFDTQDGVWTNSPGTTFMQPAVDPIDLGSGWWRLSLKANYGSVNIATYRIGIGSTGLTAGNTYSGTGLSILVSNMQAEIGEVPTTYQLTTTTSQYEFANFKKFLYADGVDDNLQTTSGGGATSAFCYMASLRCLKVGSRQTLFSDVGTNTGYKVELNASNQLEFSAGNGTSYTTVTTANTVVVGLTYTVECYHDGTNLVAILNEGTPASTACGTRTAGTAVITLFKDNGAASGYLKANIYGQIYGKNTAWTAPERAEAIAYLKLKAGI